MPYNSAADDIAFCLSQIVGFDEVAATELFADATEETVSAILTEGGKLCDSVIAPLNKAGDMTPARLENGVVRTAPGYKEGYSALADGGWVSLASSAAYGGMGLPITLNTAMNEMTSGACMAMALALVLAQGQIEALEHHASDALKERYLPKLISGEWTATMNLTEPQAGTDVGALRSTATPNGDGSYALSGQKIYITWGDHDMAENVVHLVLARLPDGVPGTKGISLFLVPKFLPNDDGSLGARNGVQVVSLEHKTGLHGSPTCVMQYDGAKGWMVGEAHQGMKAMFTMMNNARLAVSTHGIGIAEAATQAAWAYAQDRIQGRPLRAESGAIADHADVRRMLMTMRAETFAARAIGLGCGVALDMAKATKDPKWAARAALLTPIAKSFCTDTAMAVADTCIQIHGGMGYVEETGVAQFWRDVRVTAIFEGTNGIQAMDLTGRKMADGGEAAFALIDEIENGAEAARATLADLAMPVWNAAETLREMTEALLTQTDMNIRFAGATAYQAAFARVLGAHYHLKAALAEPSGPRAALARVYVTRLLPDIHSLAAQLSAGDAGLYDLPLSAFHA